MRRTRKSKIKTSLIVDRSSMGLDTDKTKDSVTTKSTGQGTEMSVTSKTFKLAKRAMKKSAENRSPIDTSYFIHISGDAYNHNTNAVYRFYFPIRDGSISYVEYEFKRQGSEFFLNVNGNPAVIVSGANDIPILITKSIYERDLGYNGPTITFHYMNRVMYSILDDLLGDYGFTWSGKDKENLVKGLINIKSYQLAWYSGDLGAERDIVMRFIRLLYSGNMANSDRVESLAKAINVVAKTHDNHHSNVTLSVLSADNRVFALTLYCKDEDPKYDATNKTRLEKLIRWDCTLNHTFLASNGIKTIEKLEDKYREECDKHGYDSGLAKFLSKKVKDRLKFDYVIGVNHVSYQDAIRKLSSVNTKYEMLLANYWLDFKPALDTNKAYVEYFQLKEGSDSRISEAKKSLLAKGIDIDVSRSFHIHMLKQRILATMTDEETDSFLMGRNDAKTLTELQDRDFELSKHVKNNINSAGISRIRKFKPVKVEKNDFWILKGLKKKDQDK